jgi:hypothetical protein
MARSTPRLPRLAAGLAVALGLLFATAAPALASDGMHASRAALSPALRAPVSLPAATGHLGVASTVSGFVLDYDGNAVVGAIVDAFWTTNDAYAGSAATGVGGAFTLTTTVSPPTPGDTVDLGVSMPDGDYFAWFRQPTGVGLTLRPGKVAVTVANWPNATAQIDACLYGDVAHGGDADSMISGASNQARAVPGTVDYACIYLDPSLGIEWMTAAPISVAPGVLSGDSISVDANDAKGIATLGWASGAPGSSAVVRLTNWPALTTATLSGRSAFTYKGSAVLRKWVSTGTNGVQTVKIPATATPGYAYVIDATRTYILPDWSDFDVSDYYQVCTLKPSSSAIRRGRTITLGGVVPAYKHTPTTTGVKKLVYLYARTVTTTKPPAKWNAAAGHRISGWTLVASMYTDGHGVFKSKLLKPLKTTYYALYYKGDKWYWPAFTSIAKVTVR